MTLTWKDLITTLLAGGTIGIYFFTNNAGEYRMPILLLAVLGITMCAFSGGTKGNAVFIGVASTLGVFALMLIVYGLITGARVAFVLLAGIILLLWLISTLRHAISA